MCISMIFPIFIRARNLFRNSADCTTSLGSLLKSGTAMGANMMGRFGSAVVDERGDSCGEAC